MDNRINNGNWTKWSAIWCKIIRVISNIDRARSAGLIWNHKYDFRPKLHDTKFNYHFITPSFEISQFNSPNIFFVGQVPIFYWSCGRFFFRKKRNRKRLYISILKSSVKISVEGNKGKNMFDLIWLVSLFLCLFSLAAKKDRGYSFERNCVLHRWESETLK